MSSGICCAMGVLPRVKSVTCDGSGAERARGSRQLRSCRALQRAIAPRCTREPRLVASLHQLASQIQADETGAACRGAQRISNRCHLGCSAARRQARRRLGGAGSPRGARTHHEDLLGVAGDGGHHGARARRGTLHGGAQSRAVGSAEHAAPGALRLRTQTRDTARGASAKAQRRQAGAPGTHAQRCDKPCERRSRAARYRTSRARCAATHPRQAHAHGRHVVGSAAPSG